GNAVLRVDARPEHTTYSLDGDASVTIRHFGEPIVVTPGSPVRVDTPPIPDPGPAPSQPRWRAPRDVMSADDEPEGAKCSAAGHACRGRRSIPPTQRLVDWTDKAVRGGFIMPLE